MTSRPEKYMDPRLRRLVRTSDDVDRLQRDLARAMVTATSEAAAAQPTPQTTLARVLVMLSSNRPPAGFSQHNWIKIVDGIYSAEIPVAELENLAAAPEVEFVEAKRELSPTLATSVPETRADLVRNPPGGSRPSTAPAWPSG